MDAKDWPSLASQVAVVACILPSNSQAIPVNIVLHGWRAELSLVCPLYRVVPCSRSSSVWVDASGMSCFVDEWDLAS